MHTNENNQLGACPGGFRWRTLRGLWQAVPGGCSLARVGQPDIVAQSGQQLQDAAGADGSVTGRFGRVRRA